MVDDFAKYLEIEWEKQRKHGILSPYFFVHPQGKKEGKHYTHTTMNDLWNAACAIVGETIGLYSGTKHSSCSQMINEYGYSIHEVQMATDHARLESVKKYAKTEVSARKALLEKKVVHLPKSGTFLARKKKEKTNDFNDNWRKCMGIEPTHQLVTGALVLKTRRPTRTLALPCMI